MFRQISQAEIATDNETERLLDFLASAPHGICSAEKQVVRSIMLRTDGRLTVVGRLYDIVSKNLGAGVYRLSLKEVRPSS